MGKDLKGVTSGNSLGCTDFGRPSTSGKWFARVNENISIINSMMLTFPKKNKHLHENIIIFPLKLHKYFLQMKKSTSFFFFHHQYL